MTEEEKSAKILLTGDVKTCSHCEKDHKHFQDKLGPEHYEYIDVNTEKGQEKLKEYGVKDGEKVDIPIKKIEVCETKTDEKGEKHKECKTKNWKDEFWSDIDKGEIPKEVYID